MKYMVLDFIGNKKIYKMWCTDLKEFATQLEKKKISK